MPIRTLSRIRYLNARSWMGKIFAPKKACHHVSQFDAGRLQEKEIIPFIRLDSKIRENSPVRADINRKIIKSIKKDHELKDMDCKLIDMKPRSICESEGLLHPTIHLFLFNDKGQLLIQKKRWGSIGNKNKLAQSVEGHVSLSASTYDPKSVHMEVSLFNMAFEQLGIVACDYNFIDKYYYASMEQNNREVVFLYKGHYSGGIIPNYTVVHWAEFFNFNEIHAQSIETPGLFTRSFLRDMNIYYARSGVTDISSGR